MDADDYRLVEAVAAQMLKMHGSDAVARVEDAAQIAAGIGDALSVEAWEDISAEIERLELHNQGC